MMCEKGKEFCKWVQILVADCYLFFCLGKLLNFFIYCIGLFTIFLSRA